MHVLAGYNFQLAVALKPPVEGRPAVLAMFLHIKPSDLDGLLDWPFPIPYTLTVLDQTRPGAQHISRKIDDPVAQVLICACICEGRGRDLQGHRDVDVRVWICLVRTNGTRSCADGTRHKWSPIFTLIMDYV